MGLSRSDHALFAPILRGVFFALSESALLHRTAFGPEGYSDKGEDVMNLTHQESITLDLPRMNLVIDRSTINKPSVSDHKKSPSIGESKYDLAFLSQFECIPLWGINDGKCACANTACPYPGKHPRIRFKENGGTKDPSVLRGWAEDGSNMAILTGNKNDLFVLDTDSEEADQQVRDRGVPKTLKVRTGRAYQYYFRTPDFSVKNRQGLLPDTDIRGEGGYVVSPGSLHRSGVRYSVVDPSPIAEAPEWLLKLLQAKSSQATDKSFSDLSMNLRGRSVEPEGAICFWINYYLQATREILEGSRNDTLFKIACSLRNKGFDQEDIYSAVVALNPLCNSPLSAGELAFISVSACRYEKTYTPVSPETHYRLDLQEEWLHNVKRKGMGDSTDAHIFLETINEGRTRAIVHPLGIEVPVSVRRLEVITGTSNPTIQKSIGRMTNKGWILYESSSDPNTRSKSIIVLDSNLQTTSNLIQGIDKNGTLYNPFSVLPFRDFHKLRWGKGRIGKSKALIMEKMFSEGLVARRSHPEDFNLSEKAFDYHFRGLRKMKLVDRIGRGQYKLVGNFIRRIEYIREFSGENAAEGKAHLRIEDQRNKYYGRSGPSKG